MNTIERESNLTHARATALIAGRATATAILTAAKEERSDRIRHQLLYAEQRALQSSEEITALLEAAMDEKHNEQHPEDSGAEPEAAHQGGVQLNPRR